MRRALGAEADSLKPPQKEHMHLLDGSCRTQRHVCRSTFAAELLGANDTVDEAMPISRILDEIENGVPSTDEARKSYEEGTRG